MAQKKNENRTFEENIRLLQQSLNGAEASITMAKRILNDLIGSSVGEKSKSGKAKPKIYEGVEGVFDGQFMVTEEGKQFQVPENYASKSLLVYGDKLKLVEEKGKQLFKQVNKVTRYKTNGVLVKKEGRWAVVTDAGSHRVLPASVSYYEVKEGDELVVVLPEDNKSAPFAAVQEVIKKKESEDNDEKGGSRREKEKPLKKKEKPEEKKKIKKKDKKSKQEEQDVKSLKKSDQEDKPLVRKDEKIVAEGDLR